jgi:hypothetical protein
MYLVSNVEVDASSSLYFVTETVSSECQTCILFRRYLSLDIFALDNNNNNVT